MCAGYSKHKLSHIPMTAVHISMNNPYWNKYRYTYHCESSLSWGNLVIKQRLKVLAESYALRLTLSEVNWCQNLNTCQAGEKLGKSEKASQSPPFIFPVTMGVSVMKQHLSVTSDALAVMTSCQSAKFLKSLQGLCAVIVLLSFLVIYAGDKVQLRSNFELCSVLALPLYTACK